MGSTQRYWRGTSVRRASRFHVPLETAWNDLAVREAGESFKSAGRFLAAPADAVKFFAEKIKPVAALDPGRIQRWLARSRERRIRRSRSGLGSTSRTGSTSNTIPRRDSEKRGIGWKSAIE